MPRSLSVLGHWLRAFWPVVLVVGGGWAYFKDPIVDSIRSTPHPVLVYTIFALALVVVWLVMLALWHYMRDEGLVLRLHAAPASDRYAMVTQMKRRSDLSALFQALFAPVRREHQEQVVQHEVHVADENMRSRLALAGYLTGALVGMGLVGTFVGLLDTLADMGALFASMTQMGDKNADPSQLLSELLTRLQEPMKGMGTAFVASLYGLMSSLVLGLVLHSAKRSCAHVMTAALNLVREVSEAQEEHTPQGQWRDVLLAWTEMLHAIRAEHAQSLQAFGDFRHTVMHLGERIGMLESIMTAKQQHDAQVAENSQKSLQSFSHMASGILSQQTEMVKLLSEQGKILQTQLNVTQSQAASSSVVQANVELIATSESPSTESLTHNGMRRKSLKPALHSVLIIMVVSAGGTWFWHQTTSSMHTEVVTTDSENQNRNAESKPKPTAASTPADQAAASDKSAATDQADENPHAAMAPASTGINTPSVRVVYVNDGDTLLDIAYRHQVSVQALLSANRHIPNPNLIRSGQWLNLPSSPNAEDRASH